MSYIQWIALFILIGLIVSKFIPAKDVQQITGEELKEKLNQKDKQYIDVRARREYEINHVEGFTNIPLKRIRREHHTLDKDKETYVICHTGIQSMDACKRLKRLGLTHLIHVKHGLKDFQ